MHLPGLFIALAALATGAPPSVTATHALVKILPGDAAPASTSASIGAAANEMESFQVVVAGGTSGLKGVSARISDLDGPSTVPASEIVLYREAYMNIVQRSDGNALPVGRVPDALVPDVDPIAHEKRNAFPFDVPAGENRVIWVDVHVPEKAKAGIYKGAVTVDASGGGHFVLPVQLEVYPFTLPSTPTYRTAYGISWAGPCIGHGKGSDCGSEAADVQLRNRYAIAALDDKVSLDSIPAQPPPGRGDAIDFTGFDKDWGSLLDGTAGTRLHGAKLTSTMVYTGNPTAADFGAWARHFRAKGWFDRLFDYTCDEPPAGCSWASIKAREEQAHAGDPELRTLVTTTVDHAKDNGFYETTGILVPVVNFVEGKAGYDYAGDQSAKYRQAETEGHLAWMYTSCMSHGCGNTVSAEYAGDSDLAGWPSAMIDHTAVRNRALPWVAFGKGFTGELYFAVDQAYGERDPWQSQWDFTGNGDGTLFYPGTPAKIGGTSDIPVDSMRLKMLRDGIEDFEYMTILARYEGLPAARQAALALMPHAYSSSDVSPEAMLAARRSIAVRIASHVAPGATVGGGTSVAGTPSGTSGGGIKGAAMVARTGCASSGAKAGLAALVFVGIGLVMLRKRG